jgi:hypothetical protein
MLNEPMMQEPSFAEMQKLNYTEMTDSQEKKLYYYPATHPY